MRSYVMTSGIIFGLLVLAHLARAAAEGLHVIGDPFFLSSTAVAAGLSLWAWRPLRSPARLR